MSGLQKWLKEIGPQLSGETSAGDVPPLGPGNLDVLRQSLRAQMTKNEMYFRITFVLGVLLGLGTLITSFLPGSKGSAWVPAAFGFSTVGAIVRAMKALGEKHSFDIMVELAVGLNDDEMLKVLKVLLRKYAKSKL